jgi:hypothetical protein
MPVTEMSVDEMTRALSSFLFIATNQLLRGKLLHYFNIPMEPNKCLFPGPIVIKPSKALIYERP